MSTTPRTDPLAFLDDEVAALRERHLYRPLRVMSSAQGPIVSIDDRRLISPLVERLPRPDPPPAPSRGGARGGPRVRRRQRGGPDHRRDDVDARGAGGRAGRVQGHAGRPHLPVRLHRQHRRHPDHHRRDGPDRVGRAQPRLDHRRHAAVEGTTRDLSPRRCGGAPRGAPEGSRGRAAGRRATTG